MFTPVTFPSSLIFWRNYNNLLRLNDGSAAFYDRPFDKEYQEQLIDFSRNYQLDVPLNIMVPSSSLRTRGKMFISHVMPKELPCGSFKQFSDDIFITSPELTFLLAARELSVAELAVLACDLCGIYYYDPYSEMGQSSREPITSTEEISFYLNRVKKFPGLKKARVAVRFAMDRSNSPMESKIAALGATRYMYGGFSLEKPQLNYMVKLSPEGEKILRRKNCCCDMVWPKQRIIVEYDSDLAHLSPNQMHYDKRRTTALQLSGYKVLNITKDYFRNENTVEALFLMIHKTLGSTANRRALEKSKEARKTAIRKIFLTR